MQHDGHIKIQCEMAVGRKLTIVNRAPVLRKTVFRIPKGHELHCKRPSFAR